MKRKFVSFTVEDVNTFKLKMLNWTKQFNIFCFLDNRDYNFSKPEFNWMSAVGSTNHLSRQPGTALTDLDTFISQQEDWLFGHFSYDLKNEITGLISSLTDGINFPALYFFIPEIIIKCERSKIDIGTFDETHEAVFSSIYNYLLPEIQINRQLNINQRFSREEYLQTVHNLRLHILRGDCYEINFCQEFYSENVVIDPLSVFIQLTNLSPNPFTCFYKNEDKYLLCASPERYIQKKGSKIISQPIKGTARRDFLNQERDDELAKELKSNQKERSENVMVVDLVRNDLSMVCKPASVKVEELFGIYKFPQVYQMISTMSGDLEENTSVGDIIRATFPMGSMTGAPKKRVMELIEKYERTKRGLFSGAVGYIDPDGDFDFNVVIRSIQYNASSKYLSFITGSAITFYSEPEKEYEECLLKASAMEKVLSGED